MITHHTDASLSVPGRRLMDSVIRHAGIDSSIRRSVIKLTETKTRLRKRMLPCTAGRVSLVDRRQHVASHSRPGEDGLRRESSP